LDLYAQSASAFGRREELCRGRGRGKELVEKEGIGAIELCGGFGNAGTARIAAAVKVPVGAVRFDIHPGLGNASGDTLF